MNRICLPKKKEEKKKKKQIMDLVDDPVRMKVATKQKKVR
jgi:hypothetical protein